MNGLEIYIHIPFCVKKCDYCDFLSAPADLETKEKYVEALINEIKLNKNKMSEYVVDTVFIGGGTLFTFRRKSDFKNYVSFKR
ncbi:MAG: hypothetical protein ACLUR5_17420 [Eubacterium ventriosum]